MNSSRAIRIALIALAGSIAAFAQMQNNTEKQMTCNNGDHGNQARHCEIRELPVASVGRLAVDTTNGSVTVKGWLQNSVLVRARIDATAENEGAAALLASKVWVDASGGQVRVTGPDRGNGNNESWWNVSYEIFVPQTGDLDLKSRNGAVSVSDVRGQIRFDLANGAVKLNRVAGEIIGATVNGSIQVDLAGSSGDNRPMNLSTKNGSVNIALPATYSARVEAETNQGAIQSDFATPTPSFEDRARPRRMAFNIGAGGPLIHVSTGNGSVRIKRAETR
jgi:hypothetical protein